MKAYPYISKDKQSGAWFYSFNYKWVCYRASQGYQTKEAAQAAAESHFARVIHDDRRNEYLNKQFDNA